MTLRTVYHRGRAVLREVCAGIWREHQRAVDKRDQFHHRRAVHEVNRMTKEHVPTERILVGDQGYWIEANGPPAGDGRLNNGPLPVT